MDYSLDPGSVLYCNEILDANGEMVSTDACASIIVTAVNEADTLRTQLADLRQKLGESEKLIKEWHDTKRSGSSALFAISSASYPSRAAYACARLQIGCFLMDGPLGVLP